jgi:hypothetical protein
LNDTVNEEITIQEFIISRAEAKDKTPVDVIYCLEIVYLDRE